MAVGERPSGGQPGCKGAKQGLLGREGVTPWDRGWLRVRGVGSGSVAPRGAADPTQRLACRLAVRCPLCTQGLEASATGSFSSWTCQRLGRKTRHREAAPLIRFFTRIMNRD